MRSRWTFITVMILGLALAGCGSSDSQTENNSRKSGSGDSLKNQENTGNRTGFAQDAGGTPVEVTPLVRGSIASFLVYNSTLETEQMADVYSRIPGLVEKIYVEEGNRISKDQPLIQIEQEEYILEEERARLNYDKKKSEFERFQALKDKNLISQEEFETARLDVRQAELQWKQASLNLDYTTVQSPISGVVGERLVRVGDRVQTSSKLFVIANPEDKVVKVFVPQDELPKCYINQKAVISTDVLPEEKFDGWVKRISPIVDPTSGTFKVTAGVRDARNQLRPGMFVQVRLVVDVKEQALLVPKPALVYENERTYLFVVYQDSVRRVELQKGFEDAEKVEVLNDIADTLNVVVVGQGGLKDGSRVEVVQEKIYPWQKKDTDKSDMKLSQAGENKASADL